MSQLLVANYFIMLAKGSGDKTGHSLGFAGSVVLRSAVPQIRLPLKNNASNLWYNPGQNYLRKCFHQ